MGKCKTFYEVFNMDVANKMLCLTKFRGKKQKKQLKTSKVSSWPLLKAYMDIK